MDEEDNIFIPEDDNLWQGVNPATVSRLRDKAHIIKWDEPMSIWCAARIGNLDRVNEHLKAGVDVNTLADGQSPLHYACQGDSEESAQLNETVQLLISKNADVKLKDKDGNTPLHLAMAKGNQNISKILIDSGADTKAKNNQLGFKITTHQNLPFPISVWPNKPVGLKTKMIRMIIF